MVSIKIMLRKTLLKALLLTPFFFSVGCVAKGISNDQSSYIILGSVVLIASGLVLPAYIPVLFRKNNLKHSFDPKWQQIAHFLGLRFHIPEKNALTPSIYGVYKNNSISINFEIEEDEATALISIPVTNPDNFYLSVRDDRIMDSQEGFFHNRLHQIASNPKLEERYVIRTNRESQASFLINNPKLAQALAELPECMWEISKGIFRLRTEVSHLNQNRAKFILDFSSQLVDIWESHFQSNKAA